MTIGWSSTLVDMAVCVDEVEKVDCWGSAPSSVVVEVDVYTFLTYVEVDWLEKEENVEVEVVISSSRWISGILICRALESGEKKRKTLLQIAFFDSVYLLSFSSIFPGITKESLQIFTLEDDY